MRRAAVVALLAACTSAEPAAPDPFADRVVAFSPGDHGGFGAGGLPGVVLGPPRGAGASAGSLDVVSLGRTGAITLGFDPPWPRDGPGPDLIVFENAFVGFAETATVEASADGVTWKAWPCDPATGTGCAGVRPVASAPGNGIPPTDPDVAGGDAFDLAAIGLSEARLVRIRDTGANVYLANTGGFDLDAVAVVAGRKP